MKILVNNKLRFLLFLIFFRSTYAANTNVIAINNLNPQLYLGKWYEIARLPMYFERKCLAPITANYKLNGKKISITNTCRLVSDGYDTASGEGYFVESSNIGKLKINFLPNWLRFTHLAEADYWILYTDYKYALVGDPNHDYLWILSRTEDFDPAIINKLIIMAKIQGFATNKLQFNYVYNAFIQNTNKKLPVSD